MKGVTVFPVLLMLCAVCAGACLLDGVQYEGTSTLHSWLNGEIARGIRVVYWLVAARLRGNSW